MKPVFIVMSLLFTSQVFGSEYILNKKDIYLKPLVSHPNDRIDNEVQIIRTNKTPRKVKLHFHAFDTRNICLRYSERTDRSSECLEWGIHTGKVKEVLLLDFKKAYELKAGQRETFSIKIIQKTEIARMSYSARALETFRPYEIKKRLFPFSGLRFNVVR